MKTLLREINFIQSQVVAEIVTEFLLKVDYEVLLSSRLHCSK